MSFPPTFLTSLEILTPKQIFEAVDALGAKRSGSIIQLEHELKPADLFCYLEARFGPPNGIQNFLRSDHSDNLIHWDWTLRHPDGIISFLGMNFRTEIQVLGRTVSEEDGTSLIEQIKSDFKTYGPAMKTVRDGLERWTEFVNPYQRLRGAVYRLVSLLDELKLDPETDKLDLPGESEDPQPVVDRWNDLARRYSQGFGLCFGIRSMLPVMAEAFVNLLLYVLMRPELRQDVRLSENAFRQHIDIRIKSLALNCVGFAQAPDYSHEACKAYHRLVNERNDLLHGNIAIDKLKFNEVYFRGKVPVFKEYKSMWERSLQRQADAVGLSAVRSELATVDALVQLPETLARLLRLVCAGASDLTGSDFHLRHGRSAVVSFCSRHGSGQQLFRAERCDDHEFVRVEGSRPGDHGSSAMAMVRNQQDYGQLKTAVQR